MALVLARKCGVNNEEIEQAIKRSTAFYRYYVDRGAIPYGDHGAVAGAHSTNGKTALAAVFFDLLGDKKATTFFSRLAVAGYDDREGGHTGPFFNLGWGPIAAARAGDAALTAYMRERQWYMDLERGWDNKHYYQGAPGRKNGPKQGFCKRWGMTGFRLMQYCAPLRKLYITGKGGQVAQELVGSELADMIRMGRRNGSAYADATVSQLIKWLGNRSPAIRIKAGKELGERGVDCSKELPALLKGPNRFARYGACLALGRVGGASPEKIKALTKAALQTEDQMLCENALVALTSDIFKEHKADIVPVLLKVAAIAYPGDPRRFIQDRICKVLFGNLFSRTDNGLLGSVKGQVKMYQPGSGQNVPPAKV